LTRKWCHFLFFHTLDLDPSVKSLGLELWSQPLKSLHLGVSLVSDPPKCKVIETCNKISICVSTTYWTFSTYIVLDSLDMVHFHFKPSLRAHPLQIRLSCPMVRDVRGIHGPLISMVTALGPCRKWTLSR
jgi:hypothetical protein